MSAALAFFFRHEADDFVFPMFSLQHIAILLCAAAGVFCIIKYRARLHAWKALPYWMAVSLIVVQTLLYGWFMTGDAAIRAAGLPLYHCRIAELAMIFALLSKWTFAKSISIYLGGYGSIVALLIPVMEAFRFPHITNFAYFLGHTLMIWTVTYLLAAADYAFTKAELIKIVIFLNLANLVILAANPALRMNYAYFEFSPIFTEFFQTWPRGIYLSVLFGLYNLLLWLTYVFGKRTVRVLPRSS